jgi:hypothetical protein
MTEIDIKIRIWARVSGSSADPYETHRFGDWMWGKDRCGSLLCLPMRECGRGLRDRGRGELEQLRMENGPTITSHLRLTKVVKERAPRWLRALQTGYADLYPGSSFNRLWGDRHCEAGALSGSHPRPMMADRYRRPIARHGSRVRRKKPRQIILGRDPVAHEKLRDQMHRILVQGRQVDVILAMSAIDCPP